MRSVRHLRVIFVLSLPTLAGCQVAPVQVFAPNGKGTYPGVIVLHTSGGLSLHEQGYAKHLSNQGYVVATVDYFAHPGTIDNIDLAYTTLRDHPSVGSNPIGMVGFSLGAKYAIDRADLYRRFHKKEVSAIVSYYIGPNLGFVKELPAPTLFLQGELDVYMTPEMLRQHCESHKIPNVPCEVVEYKGTRHAFDQSTTKYNGYDGRARSDAYKRALNFLDTHLRTSSNAPVQ